MRQSSLLKYIASSTPYQKKKLEMFIIDALHLNEEDKNTKPHCCPYCKKASDLFVCHFLKNPNICPLAS